MAVERKYERDVDLLLAEELSVNPSFASWLKSRTEIAGVTATIAHVFVSKSDNLGESDLIAIYEHSEGQRFALMIEDKIDAPLQPQQAERYRLRAEREIKLGQCSTYAVILCAPRHYLDHSEGIGGFDGTVSFEEIAAFLRTGEPSPRDLYRATFLETAATRRVNNWVREVDARTEEFWDAAYRLASEDFPILEMRRPNFTKDSTWINFRPTDFPTRPRRVYVSVKGDRGQMDLTFSGVRAHLLHELVRNLLEPGMTVHQTAASAAIRLEVPKFEIADGVEEGMFRVRAAFEACKKLITFYRMNRGALDAAAESAASDPHGVV